MVREAEKRARKYEAKIDANVLKTQTEALRPIMIRQQAEHMARVTNLEERIKALVETTGIRSLEVRDYLNVGRELSRLVSKFGLTTLQAEASGVLEKWSSRGLDASILSKVAGLFGLDLYPTENPRDAFPLLWAYKVGYAYHSPFIATNFPSLNIGTSRYYGYVFPFPIARKLRFNSVGIISSSSGTNTDVGFSMYKDRGDFYPSSKIKDLATFKINEQGMVEGPCNLTLDKGFYWLYFSRYGSGSLSVKYTTYFLQCLGYYSITATGVIGHGYADLSYPPPDLFPDGGGRTSNLFSVLLRVAEVF